MLHCRAVNKFIPVAAADGQVVSPFPRDPDAGSRKNQPKLLDID
jgi:hypothetical protein